MRLPHKSHEIAAVALDILQHILIQSQQALIYPRQIAMVRLLPGSTVRSFGLSILETLEGRGSRLASSSQVWSGVFTHFRRGRFQMLMIAGVEHLGDGTERNECKNSYEIREALKSLLNQGIYIACIGPQAGVRFLLTDCQLHQRCVGSLNPPEMQPA